MAHSVPHNVKVRKDGLKCYPMDGPNSPKNSPKPKLGLELCSTQVVSTVEQYGAPSCDVNPNGHLTTDNPPGPCGVL